MGADYTALDAYAFTLCRCMRNFSAAPARERPHLGPWLQRVLAQPAVQRVMVSEGFGAAVRVVWSGRIRQQSPCKIESQWASMRLL